jgi:hypothetical protein
MGMPVHRIDELEHLLVALDAAKGSLGVEHVRGGPVDAPMVAPRRWTEVMLPTSDSIWVATSVRFLPRAGKHGAMTDHEHYGGVLGELNPQHRALREVIPAV